MPVLFMEAEFKDDIDILAKSIANESVTQSTDTFSLIREVSDLIRKYTAIYTSTKPATTSGYNVLRSLVTNGGELTATEISNYVFRSRYTVTRLVDTLEKRGLVVRKPSIKDRRKKAVQVTRKGLDLVARAHVDMQNNVINAAFHPLTDEKLEELKSTLKMLKEHLASLVSER